MRQRRAGLRRTGGQRRLPENLAGSREGGYCGLAEVPVIVRMKSTSDWR